LKLEIASEGFKFIDGHDFKGANFNAYSIAQEANHGNGVKIKLLNTIWDLEQTIAVITKSRRIYQFYRRDTYFITNNPAIRHFKIQVDKLSDIVSII